MATVIAYVDGFNLYHGLRDKYRRRYLWLDLEHLVQRMRPGDHITAVRYFEAVAQLRLIVEWRGAGACCPRA